MSLPAFSVRNSIFGNMLTVFIIVGGLIVGANIQREVFPEVELDLVVITTIYPNASPEEVEQLVTLPIEDELREVEDIEEYTSSSVEGVSVIVVQIDPDSKYKERAINDVQRKVDQVDNLPDDAEDSTIQVITTQGPIMNVCVAGTVTEQELRTYADLLKTRLENVHGVSVVSKSGWRDEEFWVEVDPNEINSRELVLADVIQSLAQQNINRPGGKLSQPGGEVILRTIGQFHNEREIERVIVRSNTDGNHVRVGDVASVRRTYEEDSLFTKANGSRAIVLGVKKKKSGDSITIADELKRVLDEERSSLPEGIDIFITDDESYYVKRRLNVLTSNGTIGLGLVVICLLIFINIRVAIITAIGIPFAFLATILMMSFMGVTINMMTMFGLILVLGMVVDDAIIVGENIFRHIESGVDIRTAATRGTEEVMLPVVSTVLTTIAAFSPLYFAPDIYGDFLGFLPIVVAIALLASLLEVLVVMPSHVVEFVRPLKKKATTKGDQVTDHPWMRRMLKGYTRLLKKALKWHYVTIVIVLITFGISLAFARSAMRVDIFPADLIDVFAVSVTTDKDATLDSTEEISQRVEKEIMQLPDFELESIVTHVGGLFDFSRGGFKSQGTRYASVLTYLTPQNTRDRKTEAIIADLRERCKKIEGIEKIEFDMVEPGPPTGKPVEVKVRGKDLAVLKKIASEISAFLVGVEGVYDVQDDFADGKSEIHVEVDQEEAARLGLNVNVIANTIFAGFSGAESTIVREGTEEIKVRVRLMEPYRDDRNAVSELNVKNNTGRLIPMSRVADISEQKGLPGINHHNGDRVITVSASVDTDVTSSTEVNSLLDKEFKDIPTLYPGYGLIEGGEWKETKKIVDFMKQALVIAVLLIYTILVVQFGSFLQPLVLLPTIPLGMIGVIIALILHGKPISIMAMMGMVGLGGVVINDAIVLVSFINSRRKDGLATVDAIVDAGQKRLRPIVLTSVTTVSGLLPVIYGWGGYEPFIAPAAITLAYGLVFATVLTLVVVPCLYLMAYDMKQLVRKISSSVIHRPSSP